MTQVENEHGKKVPDAYEKLLTVVRQKEFMAWNGAAKRYSTRFVRIS